MILLSHPKIDLPQQQLALKGIYSIVVYHKVALMMPLT